MRDSWGSVLQCGRGVAALALGLLLASGCDVNVFHDAITTSLEVPGVEVGLFTTAKRFRFERDVAAARNAVLHQAWVAIDTEADNPEGLDLSVFSTIDIFVIEPATSRRVLAVQGKSFRPGELERSLDIVLHEDLRDFVVDQRVSLDWEIMRHALVPAWEPEAVPHLRFGIVLEIETQ